LRRGCRRDVAMECLSETRDAVDAALDELEGT